MVKAYRSLRCAEPGCTETAHYVYSSRKAAREADKDRDEYRCVRHICPDHILSPTNLRRVLVVKNGKSAKYPNLDGLFWDGDALTSSFFYGPGFKAYADDFPAGTTITVTAEVNLP